MDWFRWHHGSVNDPKFQLVAKKAGCSVAEVIAVWASLLEAASMAEVRGNPGKPDFEAIECALGLEDGKASLIYAAMETRGLIEEGCIAAWEKRQVKRERDDNSVDRVAAHRKRQVTPEESHVTPCNASVSQETPRLDKRREEVKPLPGKPGYTPGFERFWKAWPANDRKEAKPKCFEKWKAHRLEPRTDEVVAHVESLKLTAKWRDGFCPAPLTYLNQGRYETDGAASPELEYE